MALCKLSFPENRPLKRSPMIGGHRLSLREASEFLERLFLHALPIIRDLVAHNFPTLLREFETLSSSFTAIAAVNLDRDTVWQHASIFLCEPDPGQEGVRFIARNWREVQRRINREPPARVEVCCDGLWRGLRFEGSIGQPSVHFSTLFHPRHDYLGFRQNSRSFGMVYPVVRAFAYDWIRAELPNVFDALCRLYGIRKRDRDWTFFPQRKN